MQKIHGCSTNSARSPAELWFVRPHAVAADRLIFDPVSTKMQQKEGVVEVRGKLCFERTTTVVTTHGK